MRKVAGRTEKRCSTCKVVQPLGDFHRSRRRSDGHHHVCKDCKKLENRKAYTLAARARRYGLTAEALQALIDEQNGQCGICSKDITTASVVDHCHETGTIRGILCSECNLGLGKFKDDPALLEAAALYLSSSLMYVK